MPPRCARIVSKEERGQTTESDVTAVVVPWYRDFWERILAVVDDGLLGVVGRPHGVVTVDRGLLAVSS